MGRDKALLETARAPGGAEPGTIPLWQRQGAVLAQAGAEEIFLSARPEQVWVQTAMSTAAGAVGGAFTALVPDATPDCGPLAGIVAALERAAHPHLAVLAIDLPRMVPAWFALLRPKCAPGVGAVGRRTDPDPATGKVFYEPLAAFYPRELLPLAGAALARGEYSLQRLLATAVAQGFMRAHDLTTAESALFENWNEPAAGARG